MSSSLLTPAAAHDAERRAHTRLIVTRRDHETRRDHAIACLDRLADGYQFTYLAAAVAAPWFIPLLAFDVDQPYHRAHLFPNFAARVIGVKRPDRPDYLASLGLPVEASPWEVLSASGGYRVGDGVEVIPMPAYEAATGRTTAWFHAHRVRHIESLASQLISSLRPGIGYNCTQSQQTLPTPRKFKSPTAQWFWGTCPMPWWVTLPMSLAVARTPSAW